MASPSIPPLRYQKGTNGSSPNKFASRPLSELSPMAVRRNSPSFPQPKGNALMKDTPPVASSPFGGSNNSPLYFWQSRDAQSPSRENRKPHESAPTPTKRSSIENLKKASRVKNSAMFAKEQQNNYDPARPGILDGRPLSMQLQSNTPNGQPLDGLRQSDDFQVASKSPNADNTSLDSNVHSLATMTVAPLSPSKTTTSPGKSSMSKKTGASLRYSGFDPEGGIWEDEDITQRRLPEGRGLHRHAKSVTFDKAPPQVNEYEMTTPDPSSAASGSREGSYDSIDDEEDDLSFERGSSADHDDSFDASLEDTEKTPVVLPEDWRFMSPGVANTELTQRAEDVFGDVGSPSPTAKPGRADHRQHQISVNSVDSNGQTRPLPPLPPKGISEESAHTKRDSLSGTIERISSGQRALPSPPPAIGVSKSELKRMSGNSLSLEDRLRLMMLKEQEADAQRERRMRRAGSRDDVSSHTEGRLDEEHMPAVQNGVVPLDGLTSNLLQNTAWTNVREDKEAEGRLGSRNLSQYDPDTPIPSLEDPTQQHLQRDEENNAAVKQEETDENLLYSIPDMYAQEPSQHSDTDEEEGSQYSQQSVPSMSQMSDHEVETPRAQSPMLHSQTTKKPVTSERMSLPEFVDFGQNDSFNLGLDSYLTPQSGTENKNFTEEEKPLSLASQAPNQSLPDLQALRQSIQRPFTPEEQLEPPALTYLADTTSVDPGTPSSVIRHSSLSEIEAGVANEDDASEQIPFDEPREGSLDIQLTATANSLDLIQEQHPEQTPGASLGTDPREKRVSSLVQLKLSQEETNLGLGMGLEQEFDRVLEAQKRGYLMRQNTKVVVASERALQDEIDVPSVPPSEMLTSGPANEVQPSPRKASQPTWTSEPWIGKSRRRSIRVGGEKATARRRNADGPVPPMPGQASVVQEQLVAVTEDELAEDEAEDFEDGAERGRLFVKVVGVKDLQLPLPRHERTYFALTLDNGLHCVTTAWLDLGKNAAIGQEFELVVLNDLEFQLTLQMKLEPPKVERPASPSKIPSSPKKPGALGRLFGSPKKKKESEPRLPQQSPKRPTTPPSAYEMVQGLVAKDGSFARAYINLSEHEKKAFGRPLQVDITCFNEWAMEEVAIGSSRSKKGVTQLQRRPPYEIGKLELQLLFVPKPKGSKEEDMPKSMNSAIRSLREAEECMRQQATVREFEGHLSQQGGDCPYWRRRFFKLVGTKLTAYHEATLQPRATINLGKAAKLIDDKSSLAQKETTTKGGGRRKSAFAEEEEGYMFIEEGFRIRFANAEVIDFYADSKAQKEEWMQALAQVVGKGAGAASSASVKGWTEMVLKREKALAFKAKSEAAERQKSREQRQQHGEREREQPAPLSPQRAVFAKSSSIPLPAGTPGLPRPSVGHSRAENGQRDAGARSTNNSPVKSKVGVDERRLKARSMAF